MNLPIQNTASMSSREIAELTEKRHDNVLQLIRKLEVDQILSPEFQETPFNGRMLPVANLNKRDCLVLVARLSPEFTAAIVDRWQELEQQIPVVHPVALPSKKELALMVVEAEEKIELLQSACRDLTRQFITGLTPPEWAKQLNGVNVDRVQSYLAGRGILKRYESGSAVSGWKVSGSYRDKLFKQEYEDYKDKRRGYVAVLPGGAKYLYKKYLKGELTMKANWNGQFSHDVILEVEPQPQLALVHTKSAEAV